MLIQRMRDGSEGILAKVIIGLIVVVFALFGFGSITTFLAPTPKVATVNGEEITQQEMELQVERARRLQLARGVAFDEIDEDELRESVLENLVTREILSQAADDLGLYYGEADIDRDIVATEVFQMDGVFNADQFQNVLRGAGYTPLSYRDELRTDKLFGQMLTGIQKTAFVTEQETRRLTALLSQTRDLAYLEIRVADLLDEVEVTDEEIENYYNENAADFVTQEAVSLQYVELNHDALAAEIEVNESDLEAFYEERKANYAVEETRRISHILIETSDDTSDEAALAKANELLARVKDGEDFAALAEEFSDDPGSKTNGGDLGYNPRGVFVPEFEAAAFEMSRNQVSEPIKTQFGYHIIKVVDIEEGSIPTLDDLRGEMVAAYRLWATEEAFVSKSARLAELLFESIDLEVPASELGLEIRTTDLLPRDAAVYPMSESRVADAAFSPDVLLDGNNSDLIELSDSVHVGVRVAEHQPAATKALADVSEDIRYILQRRKAEEIAEVRADEILQKIRGGSLAAYVADQYGLGWQVHPDAERFQREVPPQVMREAFQLPRPADNKESLGKAVLPNGDAVVLRVSGVTAREPSAVLQQELESMRENLAGQLGSLDFQEFEQGLTESADISRNTSVN